MVKELQARFGIEDKLRFELDGHNMERAVIKTEDAEAIVYLNGAKPELPTRPVGTLIVRALAQMTPSSQTNLLEWLSSQNVPPRIIGTSARSLFPRVRRQDFSDRLYYCLNAVVVDLSRKEHVDVAF